MSLDDDQTLKQVSSNQDIFYSQSVKYCSFIHGESINYLERRDWKVVQILLSVFFVCVSEDQLPGNENKTTAIVYIDVA